jgi:tetrathionate reductase subunit B
MGRREFLKLGAGVLAGAAAAGPAALCGAGAAAAKLGFVIDLRRCSGCMACAVACKTENDVVLGKFRSGVKSHESGTYPEVARTFVPWLCNHCERPACVVNCPAEPETKPWGEAAPATYKRPDGLVVVDRERCIGCGQCVEDCPYGVRFLHPEVEAGGNPGAKAADKCDLCLHRLVNGLAPACVNTCPGSARAVVDLGDPGDPMNQALKRDRAKVGVLLPEKGTGPQCFYIDATGRLDEAYRNASDRFQRMNRS